LSARSGGWVRQFGNLENALMDHHAAEAIKLAVARTLLVAGGGLLGLGVGAVGLGLFEPWRGPDVAQGLVWVLVGAVLTAFSRLVPPPSWRT
jgi:hypothetical protein